MPNCTSQQRRGAVVPLFAFLLPVLLIFCSMAINLAYVQLSNTEMQVAVDVAVHAGGRRLGTPVANPNGTVQTLTEAKADVMDFAAEIAAMNTVAGGPALIPETAMEFGRSTRAVGQNGSFESYQFHSIGDHQIPSSFRIRSQDLELPYVFGAATPSDSFTVNAASVSTQVDRDVVLVLDRSGSMIYFEDEELLANTLQKILDETFTTGGDVIYEFRLQFRWRFQGPNASWNNSRLGNEGFMTQLEFDNANFDFRLEYRLDTDERRSRGREPEVVHEKITQEEFDHARTGRERFAGAFVGDLYYRWYTSNVIYWLEVAESQQSEEPWTHTLGDDPGAWTDGLTVAQQRAQLKGHMAIYAHDYRYKYRLNSVTLSSGGSLSSREAPAFSRWYHLDRGVTVFLNVLGGGTDPTGTQRDGTVQKEQIAILTFNSGPNNQATSNYFNPDFDYGLQDDGFPSAFVNDSNEPGYAVPHQGSTLSLRDVLGEVVPFDGTAIGDSLRESVNIIRNPGSGNPSGRARPFAAKTIVILTDGDNTVGDNPVTVAQQEIANEDVLVHTITFTPGVSATGKAAMLKVAEFGKGKHYHTDSGDQLSTIFEEIANNLPTILTQ